MDATTYTAPPSFWASDDGRIMWRGAGLHGSPMPIQIHVNVARLLRDFYAECAAADGASHVPAKLWTELTHAIDAHDEWLRRAS